MDCSSDSCGLVAGVLAGSLSFAPNFEDSLGVLDSDHKTPVPHLTAPKTRSRELPADHSIIPALDPLFAERGRWRTLVVGAWKRAEAIHCKEARMALLGLRRASRTSSMHNKNVLAMGDNQAESPHLCISGRLQHWVASPLCLFERQHF